MTLLARMRRFAQRHRLWGAETRVVAAVSGGSDSVAMLLLLHDLHVRGELRLDAVAHLHHGIRDDAAADETFVRQLAEHLGVVFVSLRVDVPALAAARRQSCEVAARVARRAFLEDVRKARGADAVALAHTQDEQAETVLLRMLRGSGRQGLGAMAPRRGSLIRPVLFATKLELQRELRRRGQTWQEDSTNADLAHPRNRVRHELLPYIERHFNPSARNALARLAEVSRADDDFLSREAAATVVHALRRAQGDVRLDRAALVAAPEAVARRVVRDALRAVSSKAAAAFHHVEAVMDVVHGRRGSAETPGIVVEHSGKSVVLVTKDRPRAVSPTFYADLPIPGVVQLPDAGVALEATGPIPVRHPDAYGGAAGGLADSATVRVTADAIVDGLVVRSRQRGDRLRPLGLGGTKKLQDVLVDRKVGRLERNRVPIVADRRGRIVWVAGHVIGEEFRVSEHTNAVIILKLRRL